MARHELTNEERMKKRGKPNPGTSLINAIKNRTHCNQKCKIFDICPMMALSQSRQNPLGTCLLNAGGNALIRRFVNVFISGKQGLENEINGVLYSYAFDIETASPQIKKDYAIMLMNWHKQQYADPNLAMEMKPNLTVVINEMGYDGKVIEIPVVPLVEKGRINNARNDIIMEAMVRERLQDDPESLLTSPMMDNLMSNLPVREGTSAESRNTTHGAGGRFVRKNGVQKQDSRESDDESVGTEGEPEELEKASESTGGGS